MIGMASSPNWTRASSMHTLIASGTDVLNVPTSKSERWMYGLTSISKFSKTSSIWRSVVGVSWSAWVNGLICNVDDKFRYLTAAVITYLSEMVQHHVLCVEGLVVVALDETVEFFGQFIDGCDKLFSATWDFSANAFQGRWPWGSSFSNALCVGLGGWIRNNALGLIAKLNHSAKACWKSKFSSLKISRTRD